jgi:hypothetical protein
MLTKAIYLKKYAGTACSLSSPITELHALTFYQLEALLHLFGWDYRFIENEKQPRLKVAHLLLS